jgi:hypothetical protein
MDGIKAAFNSTVEKYRVLGAVPGTERSSTKEDFFA